MDISTPKSSRALSSSQASSSVSSPLLRRSFGPALVLTYVTVWLLRSWKIQEVESAASRADGEQVVGAQRKGIALFYISNMFKLRRV